MENRKPQRVFSRIGAALLAVIGVTVVLTSALAILPDYLAEGGSGLSMNGWYMWFASFAPLYVCGIPVGMLILKALPEEKEQGQKLSVKSFVLFQLACFPLMYGGSIIGTWLASLFSGGTATNVLTDYAYDSSFWKVLVMVVLAPVFEEFLFRKQIIDRCIRYGEKTAVVFSAAVFGLFHMNLYQMFYAFGLGLVFGYAYVRTRRMRYSVFMHMIVNFSGSVIAPWVLSNLDSEVLQAIAGGQADESAIMEAFLPLAGVAVYGLVIVGLCIGGLTVLITQAGKLKFNITEEELPEGQQFRTAAVNAGVILFVLVCTVMSVLSLLS